MARCFAPGCPDPPTYRGRCAYHNGQMQRARKRNEPWSLVYKNPAMKGWRIAVLRRDPICVKCGKAMSSEADHIVPVQEGGAPFSVENGQGLCKSCHSKKTMAEVNARLGRG